jgi:hypothetical protein
MGRDITVAVRYNDSVEKHFSAPTVFTTVPVGGKAMISNHCQPSTSADEFFDYTRFAIRYLFAYNKPSTIGIVIR